MRTRWLQLIPAAMLAGLSACGGTSTTAPSPTPSPATTTDMFSGSLTQLGSDVHIFAVGANGSVEVSLTAVTPLSTMSLGIAVASSDGTNCLAQITQNTDARTGSVALKGTATTGNYCVRVYDSGNIPTDTDVTYTVQVAHP